MSERVGLLYGKPKVRKLVVSAGTYINSINLVHDGATLTASSGATVSKEIAPGAAVTVGATVPAASTAGTTSYHNGSTPSAGNYYYNEHTTYTFDKWSNQLGTTVSSVADGQYKFEMPVEDTTLTATGKMNKSEVNVVNAVPLTVVNADTANLTYATLNGTNYSSSGTIYRWSAQGNVTVTGVPKTGTINGPYFTGDNSQARPGAYRWWVGTAYAVKNITYKNADGSTGTLTGTAPSVNPTQGVSYSVNGSYSQGSFSTNSANAAYAGSQAAKSTTITDMTYAVNGASTTSWTRQTTKWFWNNSGDTASTSQSTASISTDYRSSYRSYVNSSATASNAASGSGQSVSQYRTVIYRTLNGVAQAASSTATSYSKSYVSVASAAAGPTLTGGATSTKYTKRTTSWYTGSGAATAPSVYSTRSSSAYTSQYLSTYPLTANQQSNIGYLYTYDELETLSYNRLSAMKTWFTTKNSSATRSSLYLMIYLSGPSAMKQLHGGEVTIALDFRSFKSTSVTMQSAYAASTKYSSMTYKYPYASATVAPLAKSYMTNYSTIRARRHYRMSIVSTDTYAIQWFLSHNYGVYLTRTYTDQITKLNGSTGYVGNSHKITSGEKYSLIFNQYKSQTLYNIWLNDDYDIGRYCGFMTSSTKIYHSSKGWISDGTYGRKASYGTSYQNLVGITDGNDSNVLVSTGYYTGVYTLSESYTASVEPFYSYVSKTTGTGTSTYTTYYG